MNCKMNYYQSDWGRGVNDKVRGDELGQWGISSCLL